MAATTRKGSVTSLALRLSLRRRRVLLVALLALLYLALILLADNNPGLAKTAFVVHLGLFMLWQPFVRADQRISPLALAILATAVISVSVWLDGWLLLLWVTLLAGVVGGKVFLFETAWTKYFFLLAMLWLVAALLLLALPMALRQGINPGTTVQAVGAWMLPAVLVVMLLLPNEQEAAGQPEVVDFVYSVIVVLLLAVLVLGSLAIMILLGHAYIEALLETLLGIGIGLLILGWVWNPHLGVAGVGTVFSRYLMSIGMPVEQWLHALADLAQRQSDPDRFVAEACEDMVRRLPWVTGVSWRAGEASGNVGTSTGRCSAFRFDTLELSIHTRYPLSPSLTWHFNLLAQLIAEFRADKLRARELKRLSYIEAIHETGARLTHDVKNLLQSLRGLCAAAAVDGDQASAELVALLRRQLPAITNRLGQTLDKLQVPRLDRDAPIPVGRWWEDLVSRYEHSSVRFVAAGEVDRQICVPAALFDHAVENLLANALEKRAASLGLDIEVKIQPENGSVAVDVIDDGAPLPPTLATDLFKGPVSSETGLGIGLYQAARLLERSGFTLLLLENNEGRVRFRLQPAAV
jgi:signal transduction histidine kinase